VITTMPRPRPPFLSREVSRHGRAVWYVRRNGKRIRLRAEFGTPEFDAEYQMALAAHQPATEVRTTAGTLGWLIECIRGAAAWQARSESTRAKWDGIYRQVLKAAGNAPLSAITPKAIRAGLERRADTPGQAQHFLNAMRALFRWATKVQLVKVDPAAGIEAPARRRDTGIRPWTEDDVAVYERQWPIGTRQRVWLDVLLYTGLRRGDAVRLGRQQVRDGIATKKTGRSLPSRSCLCWARHWWADPAAIFRSSLAPVANRWRSQASAMSSPALAVPRVYRARRMVSARLQRRGRQMRALQLPS
jgi:integrase